MATTRKIKTADELEAESRKLASKARAMRRAEAKARAEAKDQVRLDLGTAIMDEVVDMNRVDDESKGKKNADKEHADEVLIASTIIEALSSPDLVARLRGEVEKAFGVVDAEQSVDEDAKVVSSGGDEGEASTNMSGDEDASSDEDADESTDTSEGESSSHVSMDQHAVQGCEHAERADTRW